MSDEARLRVLVGEMADELRDIRSQWGDEAIWQKYNERHVADLLAQEEELR